MTSNPGALDFLPSPLRFAVVGAAKCGTTSLVDYLRQSDAIFLPTQKEIPYFVHDEKYAAGAEYLRTFYNDAPAGKAIGIAHVHMLHSPVARDRIANDCPDATIICACRNPVDRAYSAYWHLRRLNVESAATFEEALALEAERSADRHRYRNDFAYVGDGEYARQIETYVERFGRERVHVILTDDLAKEPARCVETLLQALGVRSDTSAIDFDVRSNEAGVPRWPVLHRLLLTKSWWKKMYKRTVPVALQYRARMSLKNPLLRANLKRATNEPMRPETRQRLVEHFRPHNARLEVMLGRSLSAWSSDEARS
jgi:hypothetical protein